MKMFCFAREILMFALDDCSDPPRPLAQKLLEKLIFQLA